MSDEVLDLDPSDFTIAEMLVAEEKSGMPFGEMMRNARSAKSLQAFAFIALRRKNPEASWEDAGEVKPFKEPPPKRPTRAARSKS